MRRIFIFVLVLCAAELSAEAGVVVFGNGSVLVTVSHEEKDGQLSVKTASGNAVFALDQVSWYSKDPSVNTLWAAAQAAMKDGKSNVAAILAQESSYLEPATSGEAKQMVAQYQARLEESRRPPPEPVAAPQAAAQPGGVAPPPGAGAAATPAGAPEGGAETPAEPTEQAEIGAHGWPVENSAISAEDLRVNALVVGVFGLVILFTVWKMTVSES